MENKRTHEEKTFLWVSMAADFPMRLETSAGISGGGFSASGNQNVTRFANWQRFTDDVLYEDIVREKTTGRSLRRA